MVSLCLHHVTLINNYIYVRKAYIFYVLVDNVLNIFSSFAGKLYFFMENTFNDDYG